MQLAEEAAYILIGVLLVFAAVGLLIAAGVQFASEVRSDAHAATLNLLDTLLLVLMLAEILYTLIVTLVEHVLVLRPFLIIALITAVRRILVLTAAQASLVSDSAEHFQRTIIELILHAGFDPHTRDLPRPPHPSQRRVMIHATGNLPGGGDLLHRR